MSVAPVKRKSAAKKANKKEPTTNMQFSQGMVAAVRRKLKLKDASAKNISVLSEDAALSDVTEWIPTGFTVLDQVLGGGWPVGRCSEVYGPEGVGKSALSHMAVRSAQAMGGYAVYIDFEAALDPDKMEQLGIDAERLIYCTPSDIEEAWDIIWEALDYVEANKPNAPVLLVWDSVAASVPRAETEEKSSSKSHVGLVARSMSKGCRKMFRRIAEVRAHMMFINQEREVIGGNSLFKEHTTPGGKALKYASTLRVRCTRRMRIKVGKEATGYLIKTTTDKNRCAPPHQSSYWVLDFFVGPSSDLTMLRYFMHMGRVKTAGGGTYVAPWSQRKFTKKAWMELMEDEGWRTKAEAAFQALVAEAAKVEPA